MAQTLSHGVEARRLFSSCRAQGLIDTRHDEVFWCVHSDHRGPATHSAPGRQTMVPREPSHNERHGARSVRGVRYAPRRLS
jgi:hypothetical protein